MHPRYLSSQTTWQILRAGDRDHVRGRHLVDQKAAADSNGKKSAPATWTTTTETAEIGLLSVAIATARHAAIATAIKTEMRIKRDREIGTETGAEIETATTAGIGIAIGIETEIAMEPETLPCTSATKAGGAQPRSRAKNARTRKTRLPVAQKSPSRLQQAARK